VWENLRVRPVMFIEFDGEIARWKYQDDRNIKMGSFLLHGSTGYISSSDEEVSLFYVMQHRNSNWLCYYCFRCNMLLRAYEMAAALRSALGRADYRSARSSPSPFDC
jgi:hypothetical protein